MTLHCPSCKQEIEPGFRICPFCKMKLLWCPSCSQPRKAVYPDCPFCDPDDVPLPSGGDVKIEGSIRSDINVDKSVHITNEAAGSGPKHATAKGDKCPICGDLQKEEYFVCRRCNRDFLCKRHRCDSPASYKRHPEICKTCFDMLAVHAEAAALCKAADFAASRKIIEDALDDTADWGYRLTSDFEALLITVRQEEERAERSKTDRRRLADFEPGETIAGRYHVAKLLGRGGMGKVYLVKDQELHGKQFALKFLLPELAQMESGVEKLRKEAERMIDLTHPNILRLFEFGREESAYFLKMEFAAGGTFDKRMEKRDVENHPYSPEEVLELMAEVCAGLDHAHAKGVIHRDLKPANVGFGEDGLVKIMDFGIATVLKTTLATVSAIQTTSGTLLYMSPEQLTNPRKVGPRSDLYSIGVMVYELLNGYPPFSAEAVPTRSKMGDPEPIDGLTPALNRALARFLAVDPEARPASAMELFKELEKAAKTPKWPVCPVCGEAKDAKRFTCKQCRKGEICVEHKDKEGYCPECGEAVREEKWDVEGISAQERQERDEAWWWSEKEKPAKERPDRQERDENEWWSENERYSKGRREKQRRDETELKQEERGLIVGPLTGMTFVSIPGGLFMMGSNDHENEKPVHRVDVKPFRMMTTQVTQRMWQELMGSNPSDFKGDDLPVESVSWDDCQEFIKKLNLRDPGKGYRLPSESEWEYACRAGTTTKYNTGDAESDLARAGWNSENSGDKTHPVSQKTPNTWGLCDMHGNVWEWCEDWFHENYSGAPNDGSAWVAGGGTYRVLRGGSFCRDDGNYRSANRSWGHPVYRYSIFGFRVAAGFSSP